MAKDKKTVKKTVKKKTVGAAKGNKPLEDKLDAALVLLQQMVDLLGALVAGLTSKEVV